jgi:hypothetical protein
VEVKVVLMMRMAVQVAGLREAVSNIIIKRTGTEAAVEEEPPHQQDRQLCNCSES